MTNEGSGQRFSARRTLRTVGPWAGGGGFAVAFLMLLAPVAASGVGSDLFLRGATPDNTLGELVNGCSTVSHTLDSLNPHSGVGAFNVATKASKCPRSVHVAASNAWVLAALGDLIPVRLTSTSKGVSLGLSISASVADSASIRGSTSACPITYQNSTYWNGTTWDNQTYGSADCQVLANVYVTSYAYLLDRSTGVYFYPSTAGSTSWSNESGYTASYFAYTDNFSNPSFWAYNYTAPGAWTNYSYGPGGSMSISSAATYYFNGTFSGSDRYVLGVYIDNEVFSEQASFGGTATAVLNAATLGNHEDITSVTVY